MSLKLSHRLNGASGRGEIGKKLYNDLQRRKTLSLTATQHKEPLFIFSSSSSLRR